MRGLARNKKGAKAKRQAILTEENRARLQGFYALLAQSDKRLLSRGGKIYYTVDSNVVIYLCAPDRETRGSSHLDAYESIFDDDPHEQVSILSHALADYVSEQLSETIPLILVAPMEREVYNWQLSVREDVEKLAEEKSELKVQHRARRLRSLLASSQKLDQTTEEAMIELARLSLLRQGLQSLARLQDLIARRRLAFSSNPEMLSAFPYLQSVMAQPSQADRRAWLVELVRERGWLQTILAITKLSPDQPRALHLARALSSLERWNGTISEDASRKGANARSKFVLLSSHTRLFDTLAQRLSKASTRNVKDRDWIISNLQFLLDHLRHIRGLMAQIPLLQQVSRSENSLESYVADNSIVNFSEGHFLQLWARWNTGAPGRNESSLVGDIKKGWQRFLSFATLRYKPSSGYISSQFSWQKESIDEFASSQEKLKEQIAEKVNQYWEVCFYFATQGVVAFRAGEFAKENPRQGPPIFLSSWEKTSSFIDKLMMEGSAKDFDYNSYSAGLKGLQEEFGGNKVDYASQGYKYAYYLSHAALFAGRGEWIVAARVARHARMQLQVSDYVHGRPNGREAFYLEAFCRRHAAQSNEDLKSLESLIDNAMDIAKNEEREAREKGDFVYDALRVRFRAEHVALRLSRLLFYRYLPSDDDVASLDCHFEATATELTNLRDILEASVRELRLSLFDVAKSNEISRRLEALYKILIRVHVNIIAIPFDFEDFGILHSDRIRSQKRLTELREEISTIFVHWNKKIFSSFAEFVICCSELVLSESREVRQQSLEDIVSKWTNERLSDICTFPYDRGLSGRLATIRALAVRSSNL